MIDYIKGKIEDSGEGTVTVEDRSGIGYLLNVSDNTARELAGEIGEIMVYCYMAVRENDVSLYGFATSLERKLFFMLLSVPKIGPRIALNVLGAFTPQALIQAVLSRDVKMLTVANGIGKKAAEQIVVTLHDKFEKLSDETGVVNTPETAPDDSLMDDAVLALTGLGFDNQTAIRTVRSVSEEGMSIEEIIAACLRALNR